MVEEGKKNFYKKFLYDPFPVESCLGPRLNATLNAEIAIGTVTSVEDCVGYLDWTFFARRARMNPSYYAAKSCSDEDISDFLYATVIKSLEELKESGCIIYSEDSTSVTSTRFGTAASKFYLDPKTPRTMDMGSKETRKVIKQCQGNIATSVSSSRNASSFSLPDHLEEAAVAHILYALSKTPEFAELPVRHNEEHLNMDLNESLPWGPKVPLIADDALVTIDDYHEDLMADPHTK